MRMRHLSRVPGAAVSDWVIPCPSPSNRAMFQNVKHSSLRFLQAAGIEEGSDKHKQLMTTIRALHRQYLDPFKYIEEQAPDRVDQLVAKAQLSLPWLSKYEDAWPATIYLKRFVDTRRPHLMCTRYRRRKQILDERKLQASYNVCPQLTRDVDDPGDILPGDHDSTVRKFLGSLAPSLEHHLDAFVKLGVKDQKTLQAFLSWPQEVQVQFVDGGHRDGVLQLTSLEKKGLLVGCGLVMQRALQESLVRIAKPGCFRP